MTRPACMSQARTSSGPRPFPVPRAGLRGGPAGGGGLFPRGGAFSVGGRGPDGGCLRRQVGLLEEAEAALDFLAPVPARKAVRRRVGVAGSAAKAVDLLDDVGGIVGRP